MPLSEHIIKTIQANDPEIKHLDASNYGLFDCDLEELVQLLSSNQHIVSLDISHNNIESSGAKTLVNLKQLRKLDVSENSIGDLGVKYLLGNEGIKQLKLNDNGITNKGADLLLSQIDRYKVIEISDNHKIDSTLLEKIAKSMAEKNKNIRSTSAEFFKPSQEKSSKNTSSKKTFIVKENNYLSRSIKSVKQTIRVSLN